MPRVFPTPSTPFAPALQTPVQFQWMDSRANQTHGMYGTATWAMNPSTSRGHTVIGQELGQRDYVWQYVQQFPRGAIAIGASAKGPTTAAPESVVYSLPAHRDASDSLSEWQIEEIRAVGAPSEHGQ